MRPSNVLPLLFVSVATLAIGCAPEDGDASTYDDDLTGSASAELTASVGTIALNGERLCTAALVDVDASAHVGSASLSGRQVIFGGACVGKLRGSLGGAVFVTAKGGVSIATPIVAVDFESQASAGLAVGVLSGVPSDARPIRMLGADATASAGASTATILRADENGLLVAASVEAHAGVELNLTTQCSEWHFRAAAGVEIGAGLAASERAFGAAALIRVNGELRFAASIDGECVAHRIQGAARLADSVIRAVDKLGDDLATANAGEISSIYTLHNESEDANRVNFITYRFYKDATELALSGQGTITAALQPNPSGTATCTKPGGGHPCTLHPATPFRKGQTVTVAFRHINNIPDFLHLGTNIFVSTR